MIASDGAVKTGEALSTMSAAGEAAKKKPGPGELAPAEVAKLLDGLPGAPKPPAPEPSPEVARLLGRARLLDSLALTGLAQRELRFRADSNRAAAYYAGMQMAQEAAAGGSFYQAIRYLKRYTPGYLSYPYDAMPRRYWELLFPMPWREGIETYSRQHELDPYLVAALIRQESEFNPAAISRAKARGLMQIVPATGRRLGRDLGRKVTLASLTTPDTSLRLGTLYLRQVIDQFQGRLEPALAGYNAGENRADKWLSVFSFDDRAEFVESIPFTETHDYVEAVLRNAEIYRQLYGTPKSARSGE